MYRRHLWAKSLGAYEEQELGKGHRYHPFGTGRSEDSHNLGTHIELNRVILPTFHVLEHHDDTLGFGGEGGRVASL